LALAVPTGTAVNIKLAKRDRLPYLLTEPSIEQWLKQKKRQAVSFTIPEMDSEAIDNNHDNYTKPHSA